MKLHIDKRVTANLSKCSGTLHKLKTDLPNFIRHIEWHCYSGTHFTNGLYNVIQIRWKFCFAFASILKAIATQFCTCHGSCAVLACAKIWWPVISLQHGKFSSNSIYEQNTANETGLWSQFLFQWRQWASWTHKSSVTWLFIQQAIQNKRKQHQSSALYLWGGIHRWPVDSHQKGPVSGGFPYHDVTHHPLTRYVQCFITVLLIHVMG